VLKVQHTDRAGSRNQIQIRMSSEKRNKLSEIFKFALHENPSIYEYVTFGEYDANTIRKAVLETGYYGEIYKWLYYQSKK
jgi:hypothetical protein